MHSVDNRRSGPVPAYQRENAQTLHSEYRPGHRIPGRKVSLAKPHVVVYAADFRCDHIHIKVPAMPQCINKFFNIDFCPSLWRRYVAISHIQNALLLFSKPEECLQNASKTLHRELAVKQLSAWPA